MRYTIEYENTLAFAEPVREHYCELRLAPREDERQKVLSLAITSEPESKARSYLDCYGNKVSCLDVIQPHDRLTIRLRAEVETLLANPFSFTPLSPANERRWIENELAKTPHLLDFVLAGSQVPDIEGIAFFKDAPRYSGKDWLMESVVAARDWIADRLELDEEPRANDEPLAAALERGSGNAAELTHALMALVRSWGVPSRYVTGLQDVDDDEEERRPWHVWPEVLIPGAGWRGFDVVHRLIVNDAYIAVSIGRDAADIVPLKMAFSGGAAPESPGAKLELTRQDQ